MTEGDEISVTLEVPKGWEQEGKALLDRVLDGLQRWQDAAGLDPGVRQNTEPTRRSDGIDGSSRPADPLPLDSQPGTPDQRGPTVTEASLSQGSPRGPASFDQVFRAEAEEIQKRRELRKPGADANDSPTLSGVPTVENELVGLALSGGGIRSATFNLGLLQALDRRGVLPSVDYISTVSGGGYIASCVTSLHKSQSIQEFALADLRGQSELPAMKHVRSRASYLLSDAFADLLTAPALLVRGALLNVLAAVPYLLLFAVLTDLVVSIVQYHSKSVEMLSLWGREPLTWLHFTPTLVAAAVTVAYFLISPILGRLSLVQGDRFSYQHTFALSLALTLAVGSANVLMLFVGYYEHLPPASSIVYYLMGGAVALAPLMAGKLAKHVRTIGGKVGIYAAGALGILGLGWGYVALTHFVATATIPDDGFYVYRDKIWLSDTWLPALGIALVIWIVSRWSIRADMNATSLHQFYRDRLSRTFLISSPANGGAEPRSNDRQTLQDLVGAPAPYPLLNAALNLTGSKSKDLKGRKADFFAFAPLYSGSVLTGYCSTEELYARDHKIDLGTAMAISAAAAAPNMGNTTIPPLIMIMTLLNIRLGYWLPSPKHLTKIKRGTHVGYKYLFREMMGWVDEESTFINAADGGHLENLGVYELLRRRCKLIIVGDGESDPHVRCGALATVIRYARIDMGIKIDIDLRDVHLSSDAGLSRNHCAFGTIYYPIDPSPEDGGPRDEVGYLLYIKSSLTADENPYVKHYKARNPSFPHQTTADQFFDEEQFEAYRSLGYHITNRLFGQMELSAENLEARNPQALIEELQKSASVALRPVPAYQAEFTSLQADLGRIEQTFEEPWCATFTREIYPELDLVEADQQLDANDERRLFHLASRMVQLMENVYVALNLADTTQRDDHFNRGWIELFRRWYAAPTYQRAWSVLKGCYTPGFGRFCEWLGTLVPPGA